MDYLHLSLSQCLNFCALSLYRTLCWTEWTKLRKNAQIITNDIPSHPLPNIIVESANMKYLQRIIHMQVSKWCQVVSISFFLYLNMCVRWFTVNLALKGTDYLKLSFEWLLRKLRSSVPLSTFSNCVFKGGSSWIITTGEIFLEPSESSFQKKSLETLHSAV